MMKSVEKVSENEVLDSHVLSCEFWMNFNDGICLGMMIMTCLNV